MSLEVVKRVTADFLVSETPKVIAIKGSWGTGKTYTWNSVLKETKQQNNLSLKKYAYVSLFGINSLDDLKLKIFEQTVSADLIGESPSIKTLDKFTDDIFKSVNRKSMNKIFRILPWLGKDRDPFINSVAFLSIQKTLICFDDFERKGEDLKAKYILGLISLLKEQKNCKIALIFNDNSLDEDSDKEYKNFREKVIDIELAFTPKTEECTSLIFDKNKKFDSILKSYSEWLNITNIRILQKIKKITEQTCNLIPTVENEIIDHICKTLTLYIWCYHSGEKDTPNYMFVKKHKGDFTLEDKEIPENEQYWYAILNDYKYFSTTNFDLELASIVENGYIYEEHFKKIVSARNDHILAKKGKESFFDIYDEFFHSFDDNGEELIKNLEEKFRSNVSILSLSSLNTMVHMLNKLEKNKLADELIDLYFEENQEMSLKKKESSFIPENSSLGAEITSPKLRNRIKKELNSNSKSKCLIDV